MKKAWLVVACVAAVSTGTSAAAGASTLSSTAVAGWLGTASDPIAVVDAVERHEDKLPPEFDERLSLALPDGTLQVMVALAGRDASTEAFAEGATTTLRWYSDKPRFLGTVTPDQLRTLLDSPRVTFVDPDHPLNFSLAVSATSIRARGTDAAPGVWQLIPPTVDAGGTPTDAGALISQVDGLDTAAATGAGVTAAIIDSGIDATHRDFGGWDCDPEPYEPCESRIKEAVSIGQILGDGLEPEDEPTTDLASGHGTHIAGTIAGNGFAARDAEIFPEDISAYGGDGIPVGIAPQASLVSVKNGDSQSAGLFLFALDWVETNAKRLGIRVVNNSYGCVGGCSFNPASAEANAIRDIYRAGVVMVHAAGNDGGDASGAKYSGAAQSPYTIGVANYNPRNRNQLASSSSRGSGAAALPDPVTWTPESEPPAGHRRPDVGAPGTGIWATRNLTGGTSSLVPRQSTGDLTGGTGCCIRDYASMSGTSMATPHVVGAVTLLASACPTGTPLDYMRAVFASADPTGVRSTDGTRVAAAYETGYGGLDVRAALGWIRANVPSCAPANAAPAPVIAAPGTAGVNDPVTFDATGSTDADGTIVSYSWELGDGATSTGATTQHAYTWAGDYVLRLTVTDDDGASATATRTIAVTDVPPTGFKRLSASGLTSHKCDPAAWTFTLKPVAGREAPDSVAVVWADGSRERVTRSSLKNKLATYRTTRSLSEIATRGWADVPEASTASLVLVSGPCH